MGDKQKIDLLIKALNKEHGDGSLVRASQIKQSLPRFPTGSLSLDVILGGGWPGNQWHEIVGEPSNGKTTLAFKTIAANQQRDPNFMALWIAAEEFVPSLAKMCGVDMDRVVIFESNIMEDAYDVILKAADSRSFDCVVLDSLPALVPSAEDEKSLEESTVGRHALLTNKFFRKAGKATKRSLIEDEPPFLGLVINQWRMKIGVMYGDPRTTPGGVGKDFAYFTRVEVSRSDWITAGTGDSKVRVGQEIRFRTIKNKSAPPHRVAAVDFYFADAPGFSAGEYDLGKEMVALGIHYGIIDRAGAYYSFGDLRVQGKDALVTELRGDLSLRKELEDAVLFAARPSGGLLNDNAGARST